MTQTRSEKLLDHIDPSSQIGVEIGPLTNPIVTRAMGKVYYIDHATTENLRAKYEHDPSVEIDKIVDVDYVWGEKSLVELTQAEQPFDYLLASHVIEHVPDLIGWLEEIRSILKPGGILSLAIPDKRQCFDYKRQPTRLGDLFEAYLNHSRQPTVRQIFDQFASAVSLDGLGAWAGDVDDITALVQRHSLAMARDTAKAAFESGAYCDVHCWVFTPASFVQLLKELAELNLLKFDVMQVSATVGCEFFVSLRAVDASGHPSLVRLEPADELLGLNQSNAVQGIQSLQEQLQKKEREKEKEKAEKEYFQACVQAMQSSKFWKMREAWLKIKQKLGLPTQ